MYSAKQQQTTALSSRTEAKELQAIIDQLASENKSEWEILQFITWLDPNFIPEEILFELGVNDRRRLWGIIGRLEKLSLVSVIKKGNRRGLLVKCTVQDETVKYVSKYPNKSKAPALIVARLLQLLNKFLPEVTEIPDENWNLARVYLPTVEAIFELSANRIILLPKNKELALLNAKLGSIYEHISIDARRALGYYERALAIYQSIYKGNHPDVACSLYTVGLAYQTLGDAKTSLAYFNRALTMYQRLYRGNHPNLASSFNSIGFAYQALGGAAEALAYFKKALNMRQALYISNDLEVAQSLNNVGASYYTLGYVKQGLAYFERALIMYQSIYAGNHPDVALALNNVGIAYEKLRAINIGLIYHERSLAMYQSLYEGNHPDVSSSLNAVGAAYTYLDDFGKCNLYKRLSSLPKGFINKRGLVTGDILVAKQKLQKKVLNKIQALSAKGEWSKRYMGFDWGVLGYIDKGYLEKQLGDLNSANNIKIALALCFEAITIGIANSEEHNLKCVSEFTKTYPEIISDCAREHPEYFVLEVIAAFCLEPTDHGILFVSDALNEGPTEEFKGQGTLSYKGESYYEYYNTAIDKILAARLGTLDSRIKRLDSWYITSVSKLAYKVSSEFTNNGIGLVLAPVNLYNKHWIGLAFRKLDDVIEVTYMDSEQKAILPGLMLELQNNLLSNRYESRFLRISLEKQSYNNCGPELIENFIYYLTGTRATQEGAVYLHSLLVENSLLNPQEYGLKIEENNKLIEFLSNTAPIPVRSIGASLSFSDKRSRDALAINLLPTIKQVNRLWTKWLWDKLHKAKVAIHKTTMGFKGLDLAVDSARLIHQPNVANIKKVALDSSYLYSMYSGVNSYSAFVSGVEIAYQVHLGEYHKAFNTGAATLNAMTLPYILALCNRPYLGFVYGAWVAISTAYNALENAYSFALELSEDGAELKSIMAYKELIDWFALSPLQNLYDFEAQAREYKLRINEMLFEKEKSAIEVQMKEKGEFGQKLFDYIYLPTIVENYSLLNDMISGILTEEVTEALKAKPISDVSYGSQQYDHCVEINNVISDGESAEHYYCYNMERQILDHVAITEDNNFEVLERL